MKPLIERAFEIAASGRVEDITELTEQMVREGYLRRDLAGHLGSPSLRKQLWALIRMSRGSRPPRV